MWFSLLPVYLASSYRLETITCSADSDAEVRIKLIRQNSVKTRATGLPLISNVYDEERIISPGVVTFKKLWLEDSK